MRFELIDAIVEHRPDGTEAVKNVTSAEEYLGDHFPGFPVLPGVMMLEALVQTARYWLRQEVGAGPWVVAEVRNVRYGNMVRPGQQLKLSVESKKADGERHMFQGRGTVDGEVAVTGRFTLRPVQAAVQADAGRGEAGEPSGRLEKSAAR